MSASPPSSGPSPSKQGVVLVMARRRAEGAPLAGLWTLAAGWATAARRRFGDAWILTPDGVASPEDVLSFADPAPAAGPRRARPRRHVPTVLRTAAKDVIRARAARAFGAPGDSAEWHEHELAFVWQHHDLFSSPGPAIAVRGRCPLISFVDAPQVWEARRWGVARPGWGRLVERFDELPRLRVSDVVACVSDEVARELRRLGVPSARIVVSPTAIDADRFAPSDGRIRVRHALTLDDAFVVGWAGTFRRFQGLETVVDAFARVRRDDSRARLLFVGDGAERPHIEALARGAGIGGSVVFTGPVPASDVGAYLAAMDVAVVSARPGESFHYSPLKLREYLACARAVVAPRVGEIPGFVDVGVHALLYEPGDAHALASAIIELRDDPERRHRLGAAGRELVLATATWDVRLAELLDSIAFRAAAARRSSPP